MLQRNAVRYKDAATSGLGRGTQAFPKIRRFFPGRSARPHVYSARQHHRPPRKRNAGNGTALGKAQGCHQHVPSHCGAVFQKESSVPLLCRKEPHCRNGIPCKTFPLRQKLAQISACVDRTISNYFFAQKQKIAGKQNAPYFFTWRRKLQFYSPLKKSFCNEVKMTTNTRFSERNLALK